MRLSYRLIISLKHVIFLITAQNAIFLNLYNSGNSEFLKLLQRGWCDTMQPLLELQELNYNIIFFSRKGYFTSLFGVVSAVSEGY